jgi:hypothetical protein
MGLGPLELSTGYRGITAIKDTQPKARVRMRINIYMYTYVYIRV